MKIRFLRITFIVILASLIIVNNVKACEPDPNTFFIKCSNLEVYISPGNDLNLSEYWVVNNSKEAHKIVRNKIMQDVVPVCAEDLTLVLDFLFEGGFVEWHDQNIRGQFLGGALTIEPYSTYREFELQMNNTRLLSCVYEEYKQVGDWLIISNSGRPYCNESWDPDQPGMCPVFKISPVDFVSYLRTNLSITVLLSIFGLSGKVAMTTYMLWSLRRKHRVLMSCQIITLALVIILMADIFILMKPISLFSRTIGWLIFLGIFIFVTKVSTTQNEYPRHRIG